MNNRDEIIEWYRVKDKLDIEFPYSLSINRHYDLVAQIREHFGLNCDMLSTGEDMQTRRWYCELGYNRLFARFRTQEDLFFVKFMA